MSSDLPAPQFSLWERTAVPAVPLQPLASDVDCDVLVVGAGYTGLSTALHLSQHGVHATILEAQQPGWGGSGRNAGWLEPGWWLKQPQDIEDLFGPELGQRLNRWVAGGPSRLTDWIQRYGMRIDHQPSGIILGVDKPQQASRLELEAVQWQRLGVDNAFLDRTSIRRYVGGGCYEGAILYSGGATLNPLSLSRELTRACMNQGVSVFAGTPVQQIHRNAQRWYAKTPTSMVRARALVLATDAYTEQLWPELRRAYSLWRVSLVASAPYGAACQVLPAGVPFAEFSLSSLFTLRNGPGSSLVISTHAPALANRSPSEKAAPFVRRFRQVFPDAPEPQWAMSHDGYCGLTPDMLPRISRIGPDAWAAYGYSGSGINLGLLMGGELADHIRGAGQHDWTYPVTAVKPVIARRVVEGGLRYILAPLSRGFQGRFAVS